MSIEICGKPGLLVKSRLSSRGPPIRRIRWYENDRGQVYLIMEEDREAVGMLLPSGYQDRVQEYFERFCSGETAQEVCLQDEFEIESVETRQCPMR